MGGVVAMTILPTVAFFGIIIGLMLGAEKLRGAHCDRAANDRAIRLGVHHDE